MRTDISENLTFVMSTRIDSYVRKRNLLYVTRRLSVLGCKIIILEADNTQKLSTGDLDIPNVEYHFVEDTNPCFFRTHYINTLLRMATTDVVSVWDADIVTPFKQIEEAYHYIVDDDYVLSYPYDGKYVMLTESESEKLISGSDISRLESKKLHSYFGRPFCGGAYFVQRQCYLSMGGENEHFTGWGPEDVERQKRIEIMGHKIGWIKHGTAYHLNHPRGKFSRLHVCKMREELIKVCSMDKIELMEYVKTWKHSSKSS